MFVVLYHSYQIYSSVYEIVCIWKQTGYQIINMIDWLIDWLITFIKSFLTQHNKIQHMIKYTVTVMVTKQQSNKQKKHILGIAQMHEIHTDVNISPWYLQIYRCLKADDICIYTYVYVHLYRWYICIYITHNYINIAQRNATKGYFHLLDNSMSLIRNYAICYV